MITTKLFIYYKYHKKKKNKKTKRKTTKYIKAEGNSLIYFYYEYV